MLLPPCKCTSHTLPTYLPPTQPYTNTSACLPPTPHPPTNPSPPPESGDSDDSEARAAAAAVRREPLPALEDRGDGWEADGPDEVERVLGHRWATQHTRGTAGQALEAHG